MKDKTAVILDRHPLWLEAMGDLLEDSGMVVLGKATDPSEALALVREHQPDVLIAGVERSAPEAGTGCVRRMRELHPAIKAVVVSDGNDDETIEAAFAAGAEVYCTRDAERDDLASAVRQAFHHSIYVATLANRQLTAPIPVPSRQEIAPELTRREMEILQLVAEGHSNSQLAQMLWVTEQTVKFHLSNIYRKLDVANRTEASRWAQLNGLLPLSRPAVSGFAAA